MVYIILLAIILVLGIVFSKLEQTKVNKIIYLAITFGLMWFLATFRKDMGYDYQAYINTFDIVKGLSFGDLIDAYVNGQRTVMALPAEPLFTFLTWIMTRFINSHIVMYGVYTLLIFIPVVRFIYKYCENVWFSVWLYVTLVFFFTNMNFIRQSIACSVALLGFDFFRKRKTIPLVLIILLAALFQKTAIIVIPIYFATMIKLNKHTIIGYLALVFIAFITSDKIIHFVTGFVFQSYRDSRYVNGYLGGSFIIIPLISLVACVALYPSWKKRDEFAEIMIKVLAINATFWLFGAFKHMIIERLCMYTYMYTLYALPAAISSLKAAPTVIAKRDELEASAKKKALPPAQQKELMKLTGDINDRKYYYWSAAAALVIVTFFYLYSGMNVYDNSFHNVSPYQSHIEQLHTDPPTKEEIEAYRAARQSQ